MAERAETVALVAAVVAAALFREPSIATGGATTAAVETVEGRAA